MYNQIVLGDCLVEMPKIPEHSIDMILTDLPYGTTQCKWDSIIPLSSLWIQFKRLIKDNGSIVLTSDEPFTSQLISSNLKMFKYRWVWDKVRGVGFLNAKRRPMMCTEDICVFYNKFGIYNPQMRKRDKPRKSENNNSQEVYGKAQDNFKGEILTEKYPINLITFSKSSQKDFMLHPTQKPITLFKYLIKTYTNEGEIVLDCCAGSGTTAIACLNTNRKYICIEKDEKYFNIMKERIKNREESKIEQSGDI